ncbi:MAG: SpoIIE family protein phosphatase [Bacteroidales bacterium]|nr:SpoIIE family protein phosphatase [Bacteroidales bacterium]MBN2762793.1 SpoIIE family protein phosphatase [Bacteroidales bacterium]
MLSFLHGLPAHSQTCYFENYSAADGLDSKIYSVVQDENRYVWLGTRSGVTKFNGKTFTNYSGEDGLAPLGVRVLYRDKKNVLWMGHEGGGITRYCNEKFEIIPIPDSVIKSNITSIVQNHQGQLWITTEVNGALLIKNPDDAVETLHYQHFMKGKKLGDRVFNSLVASDGSVYFIIGPDIKKYNPETDDFDSYLPDGIFRFFPFTVMFEDSRKNMWFGTYNGGLYKYNQQSKDFKYFDIKNGLAANWVTTIMEDRKHNIWVGHWDQDKSKGGLTRIGPDGLKVFNTHNGLHDNQIWCIAEDVEGNILIGTTDHGLDIFKGEQFISYSKNDGLRNDRVNAILQDSQGQIWFGTEEGISVYNNEESGVFVHYNQTTSSISNQISFLKKDRNENIWIGTYDEGLLLYDFKRKQFISQPAFNSTLGHQITAMEVDKNNHLWVGTQVGLMEYDLTEHRYIQTHDQGNTGLPGSNISALFCDNENALWVGADTKGAGKLTAGGVMLLDLKGDVTPTAFAMDYNGNTWIGTRSKGIFVCNDSVIQTWSMENGLSSNNIHLLIPDDHNNMYIGTNKGLNVIDIDQNHVYAYTRKSGFVGIETRNNAGYRDAGGHIWIGTVNGAIQCNSSHIKQTLEEPFIRITGFKVKGESVPMEENLRLRSGDNDIGFSFISICLTNSDAVKYRILLEGLHDEWQGVSDENTVTFNKLQPGRYTFNVIARNAEGVWNSIPATYKFRILPPPYKRGWFITMMLLIITSAIIAYIKIRERNLVREKHILESRVKERTLALSVANDELAMKNKDILDSITYAKRIQFSILPPDIPFDNTFILFKPKDIVSGDFYWLTKAGGKEFLAAVDCTGHGVPGAFMSFIGYTSLNKIVIEQGVYQPAEILNRLNEEVAHTLHQKGEDIVNDGMDIALVAYDENTHELQYAGAFNPLVMVRREELLETKADRFAIGRSTGKEQEFTNHTLNIEKGDVIYLFSDGYGDQFGGPEGKKFKTSKLKELFVSLNGKSMDEQRTHLEKTLENWRGGGEQIDDILVMGRKFM